MGCWLSRIVVPGVVLLGFLGLPAAQAQVPKPYEVEKIEYEAALARREPWLAAGDAHLYRLQPQRAIPYYRAALEVQATLPTGSPYRYSDNWGRERAAVSLACAYATLGDFKSAADWLERSFNYRGDWCGLGDDLKEAAARACITAWLRPGQAPETEERFLRRLIAREEKLRNDDPDSPREIVARNEAAVEARFLLAQLLYRQRRPEAALHFRQLIADSKRGFFSEHLPRLAQAYLDLLTER